MVANGCTSFYQAGDGKSNFYKIEDKRYIPIPGTDDFIKLDNYRADKVVWKNSGATLFDIGDDVLCLEFNSKMNTLGGEVLEGINTAIDKAEKEQWRGLVIGNDGENFSVGANLGMVFMMVAEEEWDEVNFAISYFQNTMMRVRYSSIPVVVAPHGMALGGGCEISLHADKIQAAAETYMGLVEVGVGVIPGGGGTKEMVLRASDAYYAGDPQIPHLSNSFLSLATAKVSTSAHEAIGIGFLNSKDSITINKRRLIADAKATVIEMSNAGYTQPLQRNDIQVLGKQVIAAFYTGANAFYRGNYMSEHDKLITEKLAYVMAGGDLSMPTKVNEQYLLDLEREAFLSLLGTRKTQERIQSILTSGKPLRN
jgi:3-hydroxyacyl-CoA dehydrogenase